MSQTVRTPAIPRISREPVDDLDGGLSLSPSDILERLWRVFTSMRTALMLMLALAALALIGTLLVQAPTGIQADAQAYAAWLDSVRPKYGGWTVVLERLQFFSVFSSVWMKAITVALVTSVLACSVNRFRGLWKTAVHPRTKMTGVFYERAFHSATVEAPADPEAALAGVRSAFRSRRYRTVVEEDAEGIHVYADRFRWAPFGTLIGHISLILILVGALVGATWGYRNAEFAAPVGSRVEVANGSGLTLEALSFSDSYYDNGAPSDYASDIALYRGNTQVARQTIRVNQPLRYDGYTFFQSFFGPAAAMQVRDAQGQVVFDRGVPLLWTSTDGKQSIGQFALPGRGMTVYVISAASGKVDPQIKAGEVQLEVYQGGNDTPIATQIVSQGQRATIAGLDFTFVRERQFTGLIVAHDPGQMFVWGGAILLVGGLFLVFFFPNRRIWTRIRRTGDGGSEVQVGATTRHDATFGPDFQRLVDDVKLALNGSSAS